MVWFCFVFSHGKLTKDDDGKRTEQSLLVFEIERGFWVSLSWRARFIIQEF